MQLLSFDCYLEHFLLYFVVLEKSIEGFGKNIKGIASKQTEILSELKRLVIDMVMLTETKKYGKVLPTQMVVYQSTLIVR